MLALLVLLGGCRSAEDQQVRRLQARAAYEQGLKGLSEKRVTLGLTQLQEAVSLDPDNPLYRNALGVVNLDLGRKAEAQEQFQKAVALDPTYAEAQHNLGLAHAEQGRFEEAVALYRKALVQPTYASPDLAYHNMGYAYLNLRKLKEAEEAFRLAIQLESRRASAHYWLGVVLVETGRREEAKGSLRTARDLDPGSIIGRSAVEVLKALGEGG
ncbi:MAG: tetratricopeptide repeat protein [candidate division NC10 bacterium]